MTERVKRTARRSGVSVILGARDEALLSALARFRLATSMDIHRLFFAGRHRDVSAARLRKLYDASYLEAHMLDRAAPNIYSLGSEGKAWLRARGSVAHGIPRPPWAHHLGIVAFWSRTAVATRQVGGLRLNRFLPDWETREQGVAAGLDVVPDALVEVATLRNGTPGMIRLAVELDRGTESLETLRRKVRAFARVHAQPGSLLDWPEFELCVLLDRAGASREPRVRDLLGMEWPRRARVWTEATDLADEFRSFLTDATPVTGSRHGYGSEQGASPDGATPLGVTGGGPSGDE